MLILFGLIRYRYYLGALVSFLLAASTNEFQTADDNTKSSRVLCSTYDGYKYIYIHSRVL